VADAAVCATNTCSGIGSFFRYGAFSRKALHPRVTHSLNASHGRNPEQRYSMYAYFPETCGRELDINRVKIKSKSRSSPAGAARSKSHPGCARIAVLEVRQRPAAR